MADTLRRRNESVIVEGGAKADSICGFQLLVIYS